MSETLLTKMLQKGIEKTLDGLNKGVDTIKKKIKN